jgi:hypothetical protein
MYFHDEFGPGGKTTKALDEAMAILKALPTSESRRWQAICDVASFQAQVIYMSNKAEAELPLEPILRVNPYFQVDQERYSPDMWAVTDKARRRVKARSTETLKVTTKPAGVLVYVDGRNMGKSPMTVKVPPGEYRVEAGFGKERTMARMVQVRGTTSVDLDQAFDGSVMTGSGVCVATNGTRDGRLKGLMRLAAYLGVKQVVGVWQEEPAQGEEYVVATAVDAGSGQQVREAKVKTSKGQVPVGGMEKLAQFISTGSAPPPVVAVVPKPSAAALAALRAQPPEDFESAGVTKQAKGGWSRRTWGLVVGGTGVGLAAAGAVFDLMAYSAYKAEKNAGAAGDEVRYKAEKLSAHSRGIAAKILYATGAVGVGAGTYLFLTGRESSTSVTVLPVGDGAMVAVSGRLP